MFFLVVTKSEMKSCNQFGRQTPGRETFWTHSGWMNACGSQEVFVQHCYGEVFSGKQPLCVVSGHVYNVLTSSWGSLGTWNSEGPIIPPVGKLANQKIVQKKWSNTSNTSLPRWSHWSKRWLGGSQLLTLLSRKVTVIGAVQRNVDKKWFTSLGWHTFWMFL